MHRHLRVRVFVWEWHFRKSIGSFVWALTCTLHYCSFSCWAFASYGNPKEGKRQIRKAKSQLFYFHSGTPLRFVSGCLRLWTDEIDCVKSECSAKVLMDMEKGKFPVAEYSRLKIKWWRSEWRAWTSCWIAKALNGFWYLKPTLLFMQGATTPTAIHYDRLYTEREPWQPGSLVL